MKHIILVEDPHPTSFAASVSLRRALKMQTVKEWLDFRLDYLSKQREHHGDLKCVYCGKDGLLEEGEPSKIATIDHVVPRALGGAEYDESNLVVACMKCNSKKGMKLYEKV